MRMPMKSETTESLVIDVHVTHTVI